MAIQTPALFGSTQEYSKHGRVYILLTRIRVRMRCYMWRRFTGCRNSGCRNSGCRNSGCRNSSCRNNDLYPDPSTATRCVSSAQRLGPGILLRRQRGSHPPLCDRYPVAIIQPYTPSQGWCWLSPKQTDVKTILFKILNCHPFTD
jgi:hypothetical protein